MVHRTVRCTPDMSGAPATSPMPLDSDRWSFCLLGPPGCPVHTGHVLFHIRCASMGAPAFCARCARIKCIAGSRWRRNSRCPAVTPDSPVNYSGVAEVNSRGCRVREGALPWSTGHVRWHTGQSGAPDQRCLRLSLAPLFEPNIWSFYWLSVNLWHLYNLYTRAN